MGDQLGQPVARAGDGRAMGGIENAVIPRHQLFQAGEILAHIAVGRRDHAGGPAHHMVATEQRLFLLQRVTDMIGGMARRGDAFQPKPSPVDPHAVMHAHIGHKVMVMGFVHRALARRRSGHRAADHSLGSTPRLQRRRCRRMVAMGMGDENMTDPRDPRACFSAARCSGISGPGSMTATWSPVPTKWTPVPLKVKGPGLGASSRDTSGDSPTSVPAATSSERSKFTRH